MNDRRCWTFKLMLLGLLLTFTSAIASAQVKLEGFITSRSGETMTLRTADNPAVVVVLTDTTRVAQVQGVFKARRKDMSMAVLVPGLAIRVEGDYNTRNQLVATSVLFKGEDLENAQAIQAGVATTQSQAQQNQAELQKQNAELQAQNAALKAEQEKVAANKAAIEAANKRFGELAEYNILDEVTVYFGNGQTKLDPKYNSQLLALATKAKTITAFMIQVKGYASSTGSVALNQRLSEERAGNVVQFLLQQGHIPLTNMLAPGAMGESRQIDPGEKTAEAEAQNRRVVVRVLQNKGIAGT